MANATTVSGARSSLRKKTSTSLQEGALQEVLHTLRKSRAGYISAMSKACSQIDVLLVDYANLAKVKSVQATLDKAWRNFQENATRYRSMLDEDSIEIHEVDMQHVTQETRKYEYDLKIEQYTVAAATHFNAQVSQDFANFGMASPTKSLRSESSRVSSRLSEASAKLRDTRMAAAKAALAAKQIEQKQKRSIEIEVKRLEMEVNQKQLELEMVKLEAEKDVAEAKERTEIAKLEAELAETEYSELMFNANSSSHHSQVQPGLTFGVTSITSSLTTPLSVPQAYTFSAKNTQVDTLPSVSTQAYTLPVARTQAYTLPAVHTQAYTLPVARTQAYTLPAVYTQAYTFPAVSTQVYTCPVVSTQVTASSATFPHVSASQPTSTQVPLFTSSSLEVPRLAEASSRVSSVPVWAPAMSSAPANTADLTGARVVYGYDSVVPPRPLTTGSGAAVQSYNYPAVPSVADSSRRPLHTTQPVSGNLLAMIATTMEKMNADHGLPALQVVKFDGSPENYPMFRQRFFQMVESKALDEPTKMARLLQFLEGPALLAVQRYESVPGGLTRALRVLQDRFGQPFKIVRACVDTLVKGPVIASQDKRGLQRYADTAQVIYDTLEAMNCLGEINTDNLEKMIQRLPKWAQAKFREHLKKLEHQGHIMPSFKDVVNFLNDRADVANHPFFSSSSTEAKFPSSKRHDANDYRFAALTTEGQKDSKNSNLALKTDRKKGVQCPMCNRSHPLYRCETFKLKPVKERNDFVKTKPICFNCINSVDHSARSCKSPIRCKAPECGKLHHTLLHLFGPSHERNVQQTNNVEAAVVPAVTLATPDGQNRPSSVCATATMAESTEILLQIIPIKVIGDNGKSINTYGLVDSGSDVTMIDPSLAEQLGIQGEASQIFLSTVNQKEKREQGVKVNFKLASATNQDTGEIAVRDAWAVKDLVIPLKYASVCKRMGQWPHLRQVPFPEVGRRKVSVLIGTNVQEAFIPLEVRKGDPNQPFAIRSCLGWSILGGSVSCSDKRQFNLNHVSCEEISLSRQLEDFWRVESCGTEKLSLKSMSVEDHKALKVIENTISKVDGHYQIGLLWKQEDPKLPFNRVAAEVRLHHLKRRFFRDPDLEVKYRAVITDYVNKGYARKLTPQEAARRSRITWYLPYHPVFNVNKPNKCRVVFDAAAKFDGTSLNDQLYQGPDLANSLTGVLVRFREEEIAFTADLEAMFHQVKVLPRDADALRFLWWSGSLDDPPDEYQMLVHIFGAASSPCCANKSVRQTADDNEERFDSEVINTVRRNFYVDDVLKSVPNEENAIRLAKQLIQLMKEGGFHLTKFASNSRKLLATLSEKERANPALNLDLDQLPIGRALGLHWDADSDTFMFKVVPTNKPPTKRGILSTVSSLFDPLGFVSPFILPVKVLLQELWRMGIQWDERVPEPLLTQWQRWMESLPLVAKIKIPRCFRSPSHATVTNVQLHYFSDASNHGYAAVSYLRLVDDEQRVHCAFVMGKTRNTPLKQWSVPRLELQAAVFSTRLHVLLHDELDLPVHSVTFWTDSRTVLQYITNEKRRFKPFVANRVNEIHDVSAPEQWRHVPTSLNPADDGSRGIQIQSLKPNCRWLCGPKFLLQHEDQWPIQQIGNIPDNDEEIRVESHVTLISHGSALDLFLRRYSSWQRLQTLMAWLLRFVEYIKNKNALPGPRGIGIGDMRSSVQKIVQLVQRQHFPEEIDSLSNGHQVKGHSKLANLCPALVEGTVRVGGRIRHSSIPFDAVHPMVLPKEHPVSTSIVRYYHQTLGHAGREHVLSVIRQKFWILQARSLVRRVLRKCVDCRKRNEAPMQQLMADLPKERLIPYEPPFTYTGVDFFGPFYVKRGRGSQKVYGCLFTCFTSRAVHIEDVSSLETDAFIQALRRFISNRGCPKEIWSDNGTNFVGADKEIQRSIKEWNQDELNKRLIKDEISCHLCPISEWKFQSPTASHMNGIWERLIRSVRKSMRAILGNQNALVGFETLRTVFAEVVTILNSRPLTPSSDDPSDFEPLTPSHFLLQRRNLSLPPGLFVSEDLYRRKQWRRAQFLADCFWKRWLREYIPALQQRHKWAREKSNLAIGDLVLVVDNNSPRGRWLLGRVVKTFPGHDHRVRVAEIKTRNGTLVRPISKLCLLEEAV